MVIICEIYAHSGSWYDRAIIIAPLYYLVILFSSPPKPEACWSSRN